MVLKRCQVRTDSANRSGARTGFASNKGGMNMHNGNGNGNGNNGGSCFPLYDSNGNVRMVLGVGPSGEPSIRMRDQNGVDRLIIGLGGGQPTIAFFNEKKEPCFLLHPDMFSFGEDGKGMFEMRPSADGSISAIMNSKGGKGALMFALSEHGEPIMALTDGAHTPRIGMSLDKDGTPRLQLAGLDGKVDWQPEIAPTKRRRRKAV